MVKIREIPSIYETPRPCPSCGRDFLPERNRFNRIAAYCSDACRSRAAFRSRTALGQREARQTPPPTPVAAGVDDSSTTRLVLNRDVPAATGLKKPSTRTTVRKLKTPRVYERAEITPSGRRSWSDEHRWRKGARVLGMSFESYRDNVLAGLKWCGRCKAWQPVSEFGPHKRRGLDSVCLESSRTAAREWNRRNRDRKAS